LNGTIVGIDRDNEEIILFVQHLQLAAPLENRYLYVLADREEIDQMRFRAYLGRVEEDPNRSLHVLEVTPPGIELPTPTPEPEQPATPPQNPDVAVATSMSRIKTPVKRAE
jgi:hypothetical protein